VLGPRRAVSILLVTVAMSFPVSLHAQRATGPKRSEPSPGAAQGRVLFTMNCSACHGADGHGGERGPDLAASEVQRLSDRDLTRIIQHGVAGMGMPAFSALAPADVKVLVSYLRVLQGAGVPLLELPGDKHAGESLFFGKAQCSTCHMVNGKGGFIGSDLSLHGSHETADQLRGVITDPKNNLPARSNATTVVTRAGETVTGILRSNDNFSIALQTLDGSFRFFQKSDLKQIDVGSHSLMPEDYGSTLDSKELDNLISYLLSIGRENPSHITTQPSRSHDDELESN
jgi:cytochrome c oxidase cbb3-type subunit III